MISRKAKEAIKTALAITITYGIALAMNWDKPMWAALAVVVISLATVGQSVNKGAMRMFGTLVGGVAALFILALFNQERWLFILALSSWVGFCTYMMGGKKQQYFWQICGLVCIIVAIEAGVDSANAFATAILRAQETALGILVYSLVALFLWPSNSKVAFETSARKRASLQHQLFQAFQGMMNHQNNTETIQKVRGQLIQEQAQFNQLLDAAESDSAEISELKPQWRRYQRQAFLLSEALEHWHESLSETEVLDLHRLMPDLNDFCSELEQRFIQIDRMFENQVPEFFPKITESKYNLDEIRKLKQFETASLAVVQNRLQELEKLTRLLFEDVSEIKGVIPLKAISKSNVNQTLESGFIPDLDRFLAVVRVVSTLWIAYLLFIYVNAIPGGSNFVLISGALAVAIAYFPQLPVSILFKPVAISVVFASVMYVFVMPRLSSFFELGILLFVMTFVIQYLLASPKQVLVRLLTLIMFISITGISNQQSYSFFAFATIALMFPMTFILLEIAAHIPFSLRPEKVIMRLLARYFRSSAFLMSTLDTDRKMILTGREQSKMAFHIKEVSALPAKLATWLPHLDAKVLGDSAPQQSRILVNSLQSLSYRLQQLIEERDKPQPELLEQKVGAEIQTWHLGVQNVFHVLKKDMTIEKPEMFHRHLDNMLERLENHLKDTLNDVGMKQVSQTEAEDFYRLLGAYRGLSEALVDYVDKVSSIDWTRWQEERFA